MPDFIEGEFPKIRFHSREELAEHLRSSFADRTKDITGYDPDGLEQVLASKIKTLQHEAFELNKDGTLLRSTFNSKVEQLVWSAEQSAVHAQRLHSKPKTSTVNESTSHMPKNSMSKRGLMLAVAGLALGGVAVVHGAVTAATAVNRESNERDWDKTALHAAEAAIGAGITWAAIAAMRGKRPIAR